jgi:hypothetical protein
MLEATPTVIAKPTFGKVQNLFLENRRCRFWASAVAVKTKTRRCGWTPTVGAKLRLKRQRWQSIATKQKNRRCCLEQRRRF